MWLKMGIELISYIKLIRRQKTRSRNNQTN